MNDRFSHACGELPERNPYICTSCTSTYGHATIGSLDDRYLRSGSRPLPGDDPDCLINCDPVPFGD